VDRGKRKTLGKTQEGLRDETRRLILGAAIKVFNESGYSRSTMQMIAARAGISRSSLYRHFETKWLVAKELIDGFWPIWLHVWKDCPLGKSTTLAQLTAWLKKMLTEQRPSKNFLFLIHEIYAVEEKAAGVSLEINDRILEIIGKNRSSPLSSYEEGSEEYFVNHLFLMQLNFFFFNCLRQPTYYEHLDVSVNAMARHMKQFIDLRTPRATGSGRSTDDNAQAPLMDLVPGIRNA
jgi:AcrR family transcriptional regulator